MWITYPQFLWISAFSADCFVESVEKLSTIFVDKWENNDMIRIMSHSGVESVEKLSTIPVDKRKRDMITLMLCVDTVESVDNFSTFSVDKWRAMLL